MKMLVLLLLMIMLAPVGSYPQPVIPTDPTPTPTDPPTDPPTPACPATYSVELVDLNENNEVIVHSESSQNITVDMWEDYGTGTLNRWVDNEVFEKGSGRTWGQSTGQCELTVVPGRFFFDKWDIKHIWNCNTVLTKDPDPNLPIMDGNQLEFHSTFVFLITFPDDAGAATNATSSEHHRFIKWGGTGCMEYTRDIATGCTAACSEYTAPLPYTEYVINVRMF